MTPLTKTVRRICLNSRDSGRALVVSLEPGDLIGVRLAGTRRTEYMPALAIYHASIKARKAAEKAAKRKVKK